jgi:hypothetical protein
MINEAMLLVLLGYGASATAVVEKLKPTLKKVLSGWSKEEWQPYAFQLTAILVVCFWLLSDSDTRFLGILGKSPANQYMEIIDFAVSAVIAFLTNEGAHRVLDAGRIVLKLKEKDTLNAPTE